MIFEFPKFLFACILAGTKDKQAVCELSKHPLQKLCGTTEALAETLGQAPSLS